MKYAGYVAENTVKGKVTSGLALIGLTPTGGILNVQASKESQLPVQDHVEAHNYVF